MSKLHDVIRWYGGMLQVMNDGLWTDVAVVMAHDQGLNHIQHPNTPTLREGALDPEMDKRVRCYMDGIDWEDELGHAADGNKLYPSERALREHSKHAVEECGIAEVEVRLVRWVLRPNH